MEITSILTVLVTYVVSSAVFFKYPTLIHKKKKLKFIAKHISHRGGAGEYYENTLTAYERAQMLGTDMIELDCHLTKDGKVVVCHDKNLSKLTGLDKNISDLYYHELPRIKNSIPVDFEPGFSYEHEDFTNADRRIPLLEDMFRTFKEMPCNIDIKGKDPVLVKEVSRLITEFNRHELCIWGSSSAKTAKYCYKENPNVNLFFSAKRVFLIVICYYTGLLPFIPIRETHLELFLPAVYEKFPNIRRYTPFSTLLLKSLDFLIIRKSLFNHLRSRGIQVYLWVLNDEKQFERAFKLGATGIMTDFPSKLSVFLKNNEQLIRGLNSSH